MSRPASAPRRRPAAAFTLIEMIGVLAIMAIVASVLVPNVLRTMDRAAVDAEEQSLDAIGEQVKVFVRENNALPSSTAPVFTPQRDVDLSRASWCKDVSTVSDIAPRDLAVNRREIVRVYLQDPDTTKQRALIISSMFNDPAYFLPTAAEIDTAAEFQGIWATADRTIPAVNWSRRAQWLALNNGGERFLIERIDLRPLYRTDLATLTFRLNNRDAAGTVGFDYTPPFGMGGSGTVVPGGYAEIPLQPKSRLNLYRDGARTILDYTYIVGTAGRTQTIDFKDGTWTPQ